MLQEKMRSRYETEALGVIMGGMVLKTMSFSWNLGILQNPSPALSTFFVQKVVLNCVFFL